MADQDFDTHGSLEIRKEIDHKEVGGTKHDQKKNPLGLISPVALAKVGQVMRHGAEKYEAHNWRKGFEWQRLIDAALIWALTKTLNPALVILPMLLVCLCFCWKWK